MHQRIPIVKGSVTNYSVENSKVFFKIVVYRDGQAICSIKKTIQEFTALDQILESKYVKYIAKGILMKGELPKKEDCNFNSIPSLDLFRNALKNYLEILSNQPNTKINGNAGNNTLDLVTEKSRATNTGQQVSSEFQGVNFLPRELLEFLNFEAKMIDDIMEAQEQRLLPQGEPIGGEHMQDSLLYGGEVDSALVKKSGNPLVDVRNFLQLLLR